MKKLINRLAKEFGLEISNTPQGSITKRHCRYVFYPGVRGSLINNAQIYGKKIYQFHQHLMLHLQNLFYYRL